MIRLLLVFAPAACICAAIGLSWLLETCSEAIKSFKTNIVTQDSTDKKSASKKKGMDGIVAIIVILLIAYFLHIFICHGTMSGA